MTIRLEERGLLTIQKVPRAIGATSSHSEGSKVEVMELDPWYVAWIAVWDGREVHRHGERGEWRSVVRESERECGKRAGSARAEEPS